MKKVLEIKLNCAKYFASTTKHFNNTKDINELRKKVFIIIVVEILQLPKTHSQILLLPNFDGQK